MKHLILTLIFIFITIYSYSQEFYGGVLAGFNGSQVEGDVASGYNKMGLMGGAWIQRDLNPNFYWGMELKLNQKGSRVLPSKKNNYSKFLYRLNYIDLPILLGYNFKPYLSIFSGLSFGYLYMTPKVIDPFGLSTTSYDYISDWELGGFIGIKVDFDRLVDRRWTKNIQLETRLQYSMLSIDNNHDFFLKYLTTGQFNNVISSALYYRIESKRFR